MMSGILDLVSGVVVPDRIGRAKIIPNNLISCASGGCLIFFALRKGREIRMYVRIGADSPPPFLPQGRGWNEPFFSFLWVHLDGLDPSALHA